jgi:hypothetical protein
METNMFYRWSIMLWCNYISNCLVRLKTSFNR